MNKEFVEKNYEIALLFSIFLYIIFPVYIVLFLICSVVALGRGQLYKERLKEFLSLSPYEDTYCLQLYSTIFMSIMLCNIE